jgi:hypothetical protein
MSVTGVFQWVGDGSNPYSWLDRGSNLNFVTLYLQDHSKLQYLALKGKSLFCVMLCKTCICNVLFYDMFVYQVG